MPIKFSTKTSDLSTLKTECLVIPVVPRKPLPKGLGGRSPKNRETLAALTKSKDFKSATGSTLVQQQPAGLEAKRLMLVRQPAKSMDAAELKKYADNLAAALTRLNIKSAAIYLPESDSVDNSALSHQLAKSLEFATYRFTELKSKKPPVPSLAGVTFVTDDKSQAAGIREGYLAGAAIGRGMNLARDLGNKPGNECTPSYLADRAKQMAAECVRLKTTILSETQMKKLGMNSLLSVSAGSVEEAKLIVMEYRNGAKDEAPVALVGKGITFDSGGISLKPGAAMDEMKFDMCGAASVFGALQSVIEMNLPINLVCVVAASENMPSGIATKPGDIVTTMQGLTVEILNTDAEGRLVLCDALTYVAQYEPHTIIDIATLTGACVVALGKHASGLYANDDSLAEELLASGEATGDRAWRMPLWEEYEKQLKSPFADLANIGGPTAGSVTAACFLAHFTREQRWAHLDIAGTAWLGGSKKGATGRPVPLLVNFLERQVQ